MTTCKCFFGPLPFTDVVPHCTTLLIDFYQDVERYPTSMAKKILDRITYSAFNCVVQTLISVYQQTQLHSSTKIKPWFIFMIKRDAASLSEQNTSDHQIQGTAVNYVLKAEGVQG